METGTAAAICLIGAIAATLLKQYHKEQALLCSIGVCVIVLLAILSYLSHIAETIQELYAKTNLPGSYLSVIWKALGVCYLTNLAVDLCRDCGETALAGTAELWGRLTLVLLALPMLKQVLELLTGVLNGS